MDNDNHPARLLLEVYSELYPKDCDYEFYDFWENPDNGHIPEKIHIHCVKGQLCNVNDGKPNAAFFSECPQCKGKGTRLVRLVGMVPVESMAKITYRQKDETYKLNVLYKLVATVEMFTHLFGYHELQLLLNRIIEAHKAGTLPPELMQSETNPDGLHEIPCDEGAST